MSFLENRSRLVGLSIVLAIILFFAVNVIASNTLRSSRADLTENGLYSLSNGTQELLAKLDEPLHMRFFLTESLVQSAPQLSAYAKRVRALLDTYANRAEGKITLEVIDPKPFSDAEDRAVGLGINRIRLASVPDPLFFGLAVTNSTDGKANIPVFSPDRETFLEYDLTRLIAELGQRGKPVVALFDGLGVIGNPTYRLPQQQIFSQLNEIYNVQLQRGDVDTLPENTKVVMVVHPQDLSERTLYTIDQWALGGGATMVFVDPNAETQIGPQPGVPPANAASNLEKLFAAWNVGYDATAAVGDPNYAMRTVRSADGRQARIINLPWLSLRESAMDKSNAALAQLSSVVFTTAGSFTTTSDAVQLAPWLQASIEAGTVDAREAANPQADPRRLFTSLKRADKPLVLAGRLSGKIKTAFPEGKPDGSKAKGDPLSESKAGANIVLFGDADMLMDRNWVQQRQIFGQRVAQAFANNGDFVLNTVEQLIGGLALADLRGRGVSWRPFDRIAAIEKAAENKYRAKEQELTKQLQETETKLRELASSEGAAKDAPLSAEGVAAIEQFRAQMLGTRAQLRNVQHDLRRDVQRLTSWIITANVGLIPSIVAVLALAFALRRPRRRVPQRRTGSQ